MKANLHKELVIWVHSSSTHQLQIHKSDSDSNQTSQNFLLTHQKFLVFFLHFQLESTAVNQTSQDGNKKEFGIVSYTE